MSDTFPIKFSPLWGDFAEVTDDLLGLNGACQMYSYNLCHLVNSKAANSAHLELSFIETVAIPNEVSLFCINNS